MLLFVTCCLLGFTVWTYFNSAALPKLPVHIDSIHPAPLISVLMPLPAEERDAEPLVKNLQGLTYPNLEFVLLDSQSDDRTSLLLHRTAENDSRFHILTGKSLPEGWTGKAFTYHQLQQHAHGNYLLFSNANVRLKPHSLQSALVLLRLNHAKLLTGFPAFNLSSLLSKLLVPMKHFIILFHLPIRFANQSAMPAVTAAHRDFMLFKRSAYDDIGGHESVRSSRMEDIHIARNMKKHGHKTFLANIAGQVSCHDYETNHKVRGRFLENNHSGSNWSVPMAMSLTVFYGIFYVLPAGWLLYGMATFNVSYIIPYLLVTAQRFIADRSVRQHWYLAFLMPLSAAAFIAVIQASIWQTPKKRPFTWKGRSYS